MLMDITTDGMQVAEQPASAWWDKNKGIADKAQNNHYLIKRFI